MIKHPQYGTLTEYLEIIRTKVEKGIPVLTGVTLIWYADQYQREKSAPPEAGGLNPTNPTNPPPSQSITLAVIDELRELNSRGDTQQLAQRLEQLAINR